MNSAWPRPWGPFLVALSALLNASVLGTWQDARNFSVAAGILSAGAVAALLLGRWLLRDSTKAAIAATAVMVWFCAFGPAHDTLVGLEGKVFPFASVRLRYTLAISAVALGMALGWLWWSRRPLLRLHRALNLTGLLLVLFAVPGLAQRTRMFAALPALAPAAQPVMSTNRPDVFFIVLDSYTSSESLQKHWGFDNTPFERELRKRGFQVLPAAHSNYRATEMTIGSMLLMSYLPREPDTASMPDRRNLMYAIQSGRVPAVFKALGYRIVNLSPFDVGGLPRHYRFAFENDFSVVGLLRHTAWVRFSRARANLGLWQEIGDINLGIFSALAEMPTPVPARPTFVYAHVMMPHPPFSFDRAGRRVGSQLLLDQSARQAAYLEQLRYANELTLRTLDQILARYQQRPVIILQGDHGYRFVPHPVGTEESFTILNAIALPPGMEAAVPPGLTPVNTFRFVFNVCFGTSYPLLEDRVTGEPGPTVWRPLRKAF